MPATGRLHHQTGVTQQYSQQWGRRRRPSRSLAFKITMAANLGPQQMACTYDINYYKKQTQLSTFFAHKRFPIIGLENSCNATILLQGGSQIVAHGRQTIGDSHFHFHTFTFTLSLSHFHFHTFTLSLSHLYYIYIYIY